MPIYEFYCAACHRIFSFLSKRVDTRKRPACPRCGKHRIDRRVSEFAISTGRHEKSSEEQPENLDESKMERAMEEMAHEAEGLAEDNPRGLGRLMRKFYDGAGLSMGAGMDEALRRMEAGEDPDTIEQELGEILEHEEPFVAGEGRGRLRPLRPPSRDSRLYEL